MVTITSVKARQIFDSRGNPTVEVRSGSYLLRFLSGFRVFRSPVMPQDCSLSGSDPMYICRTESFMQEKSIFDLLLSLETEIVCGVCFRWIFVVTTVPSPELLSPVVHPQVTSPTA